MGRGRGGYTEKQVSYRDSGGHKVTDRGAIFVAERYMDMGYETVFRREHKTEHSYDLTIKSSNDKDFVKNIEVKQITSSKVSKVASEIKKGFRQLTDRGENNGTVSIYLPNHNCSSTAIQFVKEGYEEAKRKGNVHGNVEIWFKDKKRYKI